MRQFLLSAVALVTGLTFTLATPNAAVSAVTPRGGRQILVDGSHETREGKLVAKIYQTSRGSIRGQMIYTPTTSRTRVVFTIRDQVVHARGVIDNEPVRDTFALSELFEIDLTGAQPTVRPAKKPNLKCPGWLGKVICRVAAEIITSCIEGGEVLGISCGGSGDDGGGTTGAQDDGEGTSTTG